MSMQYYPEDQLAYLAESLRAENIGSFIQPIERGDEQKHFVLSFSQQRLWFLHQLEPELAVYNISLAYHLCGQLDTMILHQSLNEIVRRHEILRTTFQEINGQPFQMIVATLQLDLPIVDLEPLSLETRKPELQRQITLEAQAPFNLMTGPHARARLLRLSENEHVLLLTVHHIVCDDWSIGRFFSELSTLYANFLQGEPSTLPEIPIQYVDFAYWQREALQGESLRKELDYWKQQLADAPAALELPIDHPRPATLSFKGALHLFTLPPLLAYRLEDLCQQIGCTSYQMLLTAFQVLLYRYTGQEDVVVGSPIASRNHVELEPLIGFLSNTLVLRSDLSGQPTFLALLERVRDATLDAYEHQNVPFEKLVDELHLHREMSYSPLFQVMFTFQTTAILELKLAGIEVEPLVVDNGTTKFDLLLALMHEGESLSGSLQYNVDLFDATTIARMAGHFQTLLESIVTEPAQNIAQLALLTKEEYQEVLLQPSNAQPDEVHNYTIHSLFEEQAQAKPDTLAVIFEDMHITYHELNRRANQLAHYLQRHGVGPEILVGVCMERSLELVIVLLAVLKAGGAYVPLDPSYPAERLTFLIEDVSASLQQKPLMILTQARLASLLPAKTTALVCLDTDWEMVNLEASTNPVGRVYPDSAAYVIFTSGSTGRPKGVINEHRGVYNRLVWMQDTYQLTEQDRVFQKTSFSFDVSVWEFFWPLISGAQMVVARPEGHKDSAYLTSLIQEKQISIIHFVPSMLQIFLDEPDLELCTSLRHVICSGEALSFEVQERFFARHTAALHNLYGPTEAAIDVTFWACQRGKRVSIGYPIANIQLYVLDQWGQPVPTGVPGELFIGGVGVARGYLNRPDLTAERFNVDPFRHQPGSRLYKTGDIARRLPGGEFEYLGRIDQQVKVRGFRIETGEIETILAQHPAVRECVVIAQGDNPGEKRLVAYMIVDAEPPSSAAEFRRFLQIKLPEYMVPAAFVTIDAFPVTSNGKLDRKRLVGLMQHVADPESQIHNRLSFIRSPYVGPRDEIEQGIADIWTNLLGIERIGIYDNFFELGGHSLLAIQVIARLRQNYPIEFTLRDFLSPEPTIANTSSALQELLTAKLEMLTDGQALQLLQSLKEA